MLENLKAEQLQEWINHDFQLQLPDNSVLSLELIEVRSLPSYLDSFPKWRQDSGLRPSPFAIVFRGPRTPALNQRMYTLTQDQFGTLENLFLVPIDEDSNGRYYEAIFN